jgi:tripartite-type tricarboxylate transporter receptor subunit TctC
VGFINDEIKWTTPDIPANKRMTILGVTGNKKINKIAPLSTQGFPAILESMNAPHHLVVPTTVSDTKFKEWRDILYRASKAKSVQETFATNYGVALNSMPDSDIQPWYYKQNLQWKRLSSDIKLDK